MRPGTGQAKAELRDLLQKKLGRPDFSPEELRVYERIFIIGIGECLEARKEGGDPDKDWWMSDEEFKNWIRKRVDGMARRIRGKMAIGMKRVDALASVPIKYFGTYKDGYCTKKLPKGVHSSPPNYLARIPDGIVCTMPRSGLPTLLEPAMRIVERALESHGGQHAGVNHVEADLVKGKFTMWLLGAYFHGDILAARYLQSREGTLNDELLFEEVRTLVLLQT